MRSVEIEGGSIDDAIERALGVLGATREQVEIDILENAVAGLFGFGRKRARVRATIRPPLALGREIEDLPAEDDPPAEDTPAAEFPAAPPRDRTGFDGATMLAEILRRADLPAAVRCVAAEGDVRRLEIDSADAEMVATCRGELIEALELVLNRIADRHASEHVRYTITVAGRRGSEDQRVLAARQGRRRRRRPGGR